MAEPGTIDICVVGGGPAGLITALTLARSGASVALVAAPHRPAGNRPDTRTAALFTGSINLLRNLGVWENCERHSETLNAIRLIDDTEGLLKAPEIKFTAGEIGLDRFGYNVPQGALVSALEAAVAAQPGRIQRIASAGAAAVRPHSGAIAIELAEGSSLEARLVAAADGRNSICRQGAGIEIEKSGYEQTAVTCIFDHSRPHDGVSTEFHRLAGPCTVVPMPGQSSSLVWVERPAVAERLMSYDDTAFTRILEQRLGGLLGLVSNVSPRAAFPLTSVHANRMAANRVALIGEAGHVMPPIGAQGLNLSFRDAAVLAELVAREREKDGDPGAPALMEAYDAARRGDVRTRTLMVDILNRTLTSSFTPIQLARGLGLHALNAITPLRHRLIHEGLQPTGNVPELMKA